MGFEDGVMECHIPFGGTDLVHDLQVLQLWCRSREPFQHGFEVLEVGAYLQPLEAMEIVECGGKEGLCVLLAFEELVDVEGLVLGSTKEALCLF